MMVVSPGRSAVSRPRRYRSTVRWIQAIPPPQPPPNRHQPPDLDCLRCVVLCTSIPNYVGFTSSSGSSNPITLVMRNSKRLKPEIEFPHVRCWSISRRNPPRFVPRFSAGVGRIRRQTAKSACRPGCVKTQHLVKRIEVLSNIMMICNSFYRKCS